MIGHLDKFPYADAKDFLDQTEEAQALPFFIEIAPFMDEQEWLALLNSTWPRIKNADQYQDQLRQTPYGKQADEKSQTNINWARHHIHNNSLNIAPLRVALTDHLRRPAC